MGFMSYCRFENTTPELNACARALENGEILNQYEEPYRELLYKAAQRYIAAYDEYEPRREDGEDD